MKVRADLGQGHLGDDGEHDLLALGRVRVLDVLEQPGLEGAGRLTCGVLAPNVEASIAEGKNNYRIIGKNYTL